MKKCFTVLGLSLLFSACGNSSEESKEPEPQSTKVDERKNVSVAEPVLEKALTGTYTGKLPCETCDGIITNIILRDNNTYAITAKTSNDTVFTMPLVDTGTFIMRDSILELKDPSGEIRKYLITQNALVQLDADGRPLDEAGQALYVFKKQ